jgi:hypothetical protein
MNDKKIKYVGIVIKGTLPNRHRQHTREEWYKNGRYVCECIEVDNKSEAEAIESHLISLYETDKYYNKSKAGWGINKYLPVEYDWKIANVNDETIEDIVESLYIHSDWILRDSKTNKEISNIMLNFAERITEAQKRQKNIEEWINSKQ